MKLNNIYLGAALAAALSACGGGTDTAGSPSSARLMQGGTVHQGAAAANPYATVVQQLYVAYFGRPADAGGLVNFEAALAAAGAPADIAQLTSAYGSNPAVKSLIDGFGTSDESNRLYGGDTQAFVKAVYQSIFNRAPLAAGLKFWTDSIDSGTLTKGNAALSIMAGALTNQSAQGLIDGAAVRNKIAVGAYFTDSLVLPANVNGYRGQAAAAAARALLAAVDNATDTAAYQATVAATLAKLSVSATSLAPNFQWNVVTPAQLVLTDAQGAVLPATGLSCAALDASAVTVAADCSTIQAKRLGTQKISVSGSNVIATLTLTAIPQRQPFGTQGVTSSYGSGSYNLVVNPAGNVLAWGANPGGVLGQGGDSRTVAAKSLPTLVKDGGGNGVLADIVAVSAGNKVALALSAAGEVLIWGDGERMTRASDVNLYLPSKVRNAANNGNLQHIVQVGVGDSNAVALADDGTVYSWGYYNGQGTSGLAYPSLVQDPVAGGPLSNIVAVSAGANFALALRADGKVFAWGWNAGGQTGRGSINGSFEAYPATVKLAEGGELGNVVAISAGNRFAMALTAGGQVYAWGDNSYGSVGQNSDRPITYSSAVLVKAVNGTTLGNIKMVAAGGWHALALDNDGRVVSWGLSSDGQLGDGPNGRNGVTRLNVLPVVNTAATGQLGGIVALAAGYEHSLALSADGTILIWGDGFNNNLGQGGGSNADNPVPTSVKNAAGDGPLQLSALASYPNLLMHGR
jgi:alpha-tubulin suppressor-like RCC1 family protein